MYVIVFSVFYWVFVVLQHRFILKNLGHSCLFLEHFGIFKN